MGFNKRKNDDPRVSEPAWGCIGAVVAAVIGAIALLLSVIIQIENSQGIRQPVLVVVVDIIFDGDDGNPEANETPTAIDQTLAWIETLAVPTVQPSAEPTSVLTTPSIPTVSSQRYELVEQEATGNSPDPITYSFSIGEGEIVVAEGWRLDVIDNVQETHEECMVFLAVGPKNFELAVTAGVWFRYRNVDSAQAQVLFNERIYYVENLPQCNSDKLKAITLE